MSENPDLQKSWTTLASITQHDHSQLTKLTKGPGKKEGQGEKKGQEEKKGQGQEGQGQTESQGKTKGRGQRESSGKEEVKGRSGSRIKVKAEEAAAPPGG